MTSSAVPSAETDPKRGEIWMVTLDPTVGDEMQKRRPAVVVSANGLGRLRLRVVVPLTGSSTANYWMVPIPASALNGLEKDSTADAFQVRSVSLERFARKRGQLEADLLEQVVSAIGIVVDM